MKKKTYFKPVVDILYTTTEIDVALNLSVAKGRGDNLEIGYGDEDEDDYVDPTTNHSHLWDEFE
jgi:hypothetical protein